jgi:hypothetical protein
MKLCNDTTIAFLYKWPIFPYLSILFTPQSLAISLLQHLTTVMVSVLASSAVDRGFEPQSGQTKHYQSVCVASPLSKQH